MMPLCKMNLLSAIWRSRPSVGALPAVVSVAAALAIAVPGGASGSETEVQAKGPLAPLFGTLANAGSGQASAAAVIVPGSGPTDRDGNNPFGMQAATYRLLAEALAAQGIASVRIDKRGMFASAEAIRNPFDVTIADYADDALIWAKRAAELTGQSCAWIIGHSEGGLVALAAAARAEQGLCGLVLLATPGRPLGEIIRAQFQVGGADASMMTAVEGALAKLEQGQSVDSSTLPNGPKQLFMAAVQPFLIDALRYEPAAMLSSLRLPVLVVSAGEDLQVFAEDAATLANAGDHVQSVEIEGANHMFKPVPKGSDRHANFAAYMNPDLPLAAGLADAVAGFLRAHSPQ